MITYEHSPGTLRVSVFGEFTLADYQEFEEQVDYKLKFEGQTNLLFDLSQMAGFTLDVAWEDIKFTREHSQDFNKIAVVTDSQWITWSAWLSQVFVSADISVFEDAEEASAWVSQQGAKE